MNKNPHIGSSFDAFLEEDGTFDEINLIATKRVISWQIKQAMAEKNITKKALAEEMKTSRSSIDRLLDPDNTSVTLDTIDRAARVIGKKIHFELIDTV
ncbi:helix-turn-helix domain-containing protein [Cylindrospermum sp. FACHB-282]|uniref:helix-turn-helix domain-containing protein n=1 Tax=Cylindrospermum sp. FACHB-282 TaxID=2692794 RepID=UPI001688425C|nr:helix-turn-helix transcriptional regulator [Cylindrospermum sp. FACHB-282]MBD2384892.1 XRE family transcriptional regulator [Cylindrospermum sp. FACHB-282]